MKIYYCFPEGKAKALTMSYDDGRSQDERLIGIFNKYGIKATFNLNYGLMDQPERIGAERIREVYQGHEIATHTLTHPTIARCPLAQCASEILEDRAGLESLAGYVVRGHAYPNGSYSRELEELFAGLGIAYARTVKSCPDLELPVNPMEWNPTCHHNDPSLMEMGRSFVEYGKRQYWKLLYVWGHSYEFDNDGNWDRIEEFCRLTGGRDDIWYATNIEIIDYLQVIRGLRFTADNTGVYNPFVQSAWLQADDSRIVEAKGGCFTSLEA